MDDRIAKFSLCYVRILIGFGTCIQIKVDVLAPTQVRLRISLG